MTAKPEPMYDDIWAILKHKGKCKVAAHPALQRRIIHAVVNKKYYDAAFKFELSEQTPSMHCIMTYVRSASMVEFVLKIYPIPKISRAFVKLGDI